MTRTWGTQSHRARARPSDSPRMSASLAPSSEAHQGASAPSGRRRRRSWVGNGRAHVEVRGIHEKDRVRMVGALERELVRLGGVDWAAVNQVTGRVVAAFDDQQVGLDEIVDVIEGVEEGHGLADEPFPSGRPEHPADTEPLRRARWILAADVAGTGLSLFTRRIRTNPLTAEAAALVGLVESTPALRRPIEERLGPAADAGLATAQAVAQGLAGTPLALAVDAVHRALTVEEIRARQQAWEDREPELHGDRAAGCAPLDVPQRAAPLQDGPIERYARRSAMGGLTGAAAALAATRDPRLAVAATVAGSPKAARLGREVFAASLGRLLAERGVLPMDPAALRRLDRVDTVVLGTDALLTGDWTLGAVWIPQERADPENDLWLVARILFDPQTPSTIQKADGWQLAPVSDAELAGAGPARAARRTLSHTSGRVLALRDDHGVAALLEVQHALDPLAKAVAAAAKQVGHVYVAGMHAGVGQRLGVSQSVRGGNYLKTEIRRLQDSGHVVAVVSTRRHSALATADVGIGVQRPGTHSPWGAHLLTSRGLLDAWLVLESVPVARTVSHRSVACAAYGAGAGGLLALAGRRRGATARAGLAVTAASAVSVAWGVWSAHGLGQRPEPVAEQATDWHAIAVAEALDLLESRPQGLSDAEAPHRSSGATMTARDGSGDVARIVRATLEELANPLTPALATGAGLAAALGSVSDAGLISSVMGLNAVVGAIQRIGADRAVERLLEASGTRVHARRGGVETLVLSDDVVVGDVLVLHPGDGVPADCRIVATDGVEMDEATVTGESQLVTKTAEPSAAQAVADRHSMLYAGTAVAAGEVTAVVVATGEDTEMGRSARLVASQRKSSGVEARLRRLTKQTVPVSLGAGVALLASGAAHGRPLVRTLSTGVGLAVAAVPEGLPLVATVAQLAAARRLSHRGVLVRHASTIEALGRVTVLCADKTGTLTTGKIQLRSVSDGICEQPLQDLDARGRAIVAAALRASPTPRQGERAAHPTDRAVIKGAEEAGVTDGLGAPGWRVDTVLPFEPSRGYHAVLGRVRGGRRLAVKGAPEVVLPRCTTWRRPDGVEPLDDPSTQVLHREIDRLARRGYRVLVVAERPATDRGDLDDDRIARLELLGLVAMGDPVRASAAEAVSGLQAAGVSVTMLTGDHPSTAEAIAAELGLLNGSTVLTGPELSRLSDEQLAERVRSVAVFARVTPAQKVRIVQALQNSGAVVAMTGDGANDAAAIRLADVGLALGKRATNAAKDAADVVVTDNRIETIIDAVIEGRAMWASVRDAVAVLLGGNLGEIALTLGSELLHEDHCAVIVGLRLIERAAHVVDGGVHPVVLLGAPAPRPPVTRTHDLPPVRDVEHVALGGSVNSRGTPVARRDHRGGFSVSPAVPGRHRAGSSRSLDVSAFIPLTRPCNDACGGHGNRVRHRRAARHTWCGATLGRRRASSPRDPLQPHGALRGGHVPGQWAAGEPGGSTYHAGRLPSRRRGVPGRADRRGLQQRTGRGRARAGRRVAAGGRRLHRAGATDGEGPRGGAAHVLRVRPRLQP